MNNDASAATTIRPGKVVRFTDLEVWRRSHDLYLALLVDLESLPNSRVAGILIDQTIRAVGSIGANLAEGFNRSRAKYLSSIDIALGEANEAENWLYKIRDAEFLSLDLANLRIAEMIRIEKMLAALSRSIAARPDRPKPRPKPAAAPSQPQPPTPNT